VLEGMIDLNQFSTAVEGLSQYVSLRGDESSDKITFHAPERAYGVVAEPKPANECYPDWFKALSRNGLADNAETGLDKTAAACQPLSDALSTGWVLPCPVDIKIEYNADANELDFYVYSDIRDNEDLVSVESNSVLQLGDKFPESLDGKVLIQINTPWVAETRDGFSTLITPAINRPDSRFTPFSGMIDTDNYPRMLNVVTLVDVPDGKTVIEKGTPFASIVPMRRADMGGVAKIESNSQREMDRLQTPHDSSNTYEERGYQKSGWVPKNTPSNEYEGFKYGYDE